MKEILTFWEYISDHKEVEERKKLQLSDAGWIIKAVVNHAWQVMLIKAKKKKTKAKTLVSVLSDTVCNEISCKA